MRDVIISDAAKRELRLINGYLKAFGVKVSDSFVDEVERKIAILREGTVEFPSSRQPRLAKADYHITLVKGYLMLYRILGDGSVYVAHVFHQSQDYAALVTGRE